MIAAPRYAPFNTGMLDAVGEVVLEVLCGPADPLALMASTLRQAPPVVAGSPFRPWPWCTLQVFPRLRTLTPQRDPFRLVGEAGRRLAERGLIEIAVTNTKMVRSRGRIRFARAIAGPALYEVEAEPLVVPETPQRRYYESVEGRVVDHVARHLLALLAEEVSDADTQAMRTASCWRSSPDGDGWRVWPYLLPRLVARAGLTGGAARNAQVAGWAAWRLARNGRVDVATSPVRGSAVGRIRFARLAEASC